jgi:hypothetical protein
MSDNNSNSIELKGKLFDTKNFLNSEIDSNIENINVNSGHLKWDIFYSKDDRFQQFKFNVKNFVIKDCYTIEDLKGWSTFFNSWDFCLSYTTKKFDNMNIIFEFNKDLEKKIDVNQYVLYCSQKQFLLVILKRFGEKFENFKLTFDK